MWRRYAVLPLLLLLTASAPYPDMTGVGEAAHGMSDSQTALYFMLVLLVVAAIERGATVWRHGRTSARLAESIDKLREVMTNEASQTMANQAVIRHVQTQILRELAAAKDERKKIASALSKRQR